MNGLQPSTSFPANLFPYPQSRHTVKRIISRMDYTLQGFADANGISRGAFFHVINHYLPGCIMTRKQRKIAILLGIIPANLPKGGLPS